MAITANNFAYITLCVFSAARLWIHGDSSMVILCINTFFWAICYTLIVYTNIHMGHFSSLEASDKNRLNIENEKKIEFCY